MSQDNKIDDLSLMLGKMQSSIDALDKHSVKQSGVMQTQYITLNEQLQKLLQKEEVRDNKLSSLHKRYDALGDTITNKIEPRLSRIEKAMTYFSGVLATIGIIWASVSGFITHIVKGLFS